jgi:signal peptidase I
LEQQKKKSIGREILEWVILIVAAFLIASIIQSQLFALTEVNMTSMMDTLVQGDKLIMSKLAYASNEPQRGDIIIFLRDESVNGVIGRMGIYISDVALKLRGDFRRNRLIKRVIGIPGDKVEIRNNVLYINDEPVTEDYARDRTGTGDGAKRQHGSGGGPKGPAVRPGRQQGPEHGQPELWGYRNWNGLKARPYSGFCPSRSSERSSKNMDSHIRITGDIFPGFFTSSSALHEKIIVKVVDNEGETVQ